MLLSRKSGECINMCMHIILIFLFYRSHLDACHQQLELQLLETKRTLEHYNTLGPDFISLAEDYHHIKGEIENKQWALQELGKTNQYF